MAAQPFDFDLVTRTPGPPLSRFVEAIWYARGTVPYSETINPTGSSLAVFVLGDPMLCGAFGDGRRPLRAEHGFFVGPHDRPMVNEPTGETIAVGIVSKAVGCQALFGVVPSHLRGQAHDLETIWPAATFLRESLLTTDSKEAMLDMVEQYLAATLDTSTVGLERCEKAIELLEVDPTRPIADIAEDLGVSHGHLDRELTRIVGLTPRALARLMRIRCLLQNIDTYGSHEWGELVAKLGWTDQTHLLRDFERHTGVTPADYIAAQQTSVPAALSHAGFVPDY